MCNFARPPRMWAPMSGNYVPLPGQNAPKVLGVQGKGRKLGQLPLLGGPSWVQLLWVLLEDLVGFQDRGRQLGRDPRFFRHEASVEEALAELKRKEAAQAEPEAALELCWAPQKRSTHSAPHSQGSKRSQSGHEEAMHGVWSWLLLGKQLVLFCLWFIGCSPSNIATSTKTSSQTNLILTP